PSCSLPTRSPPARRLSATWTATSAAAAPITASSPPSSALRGRAKAMTIMDRDISRRGVLAGLGSMSFCLALGTDGVRLFSQAQASAMANANVTPWVRIAPDGTVTILSAGAEMGQGSMTSLPLILAEEMDAEWSKVAIEWAPAEAKTYGYKFGNEHMM